METYENCVYIVSVKLAFNGFYAQERCHIMERHCSATAERLVLS